MLRYLLAAVVIFGAVIVMLAGALGNLKSLPEMNAGLPTSVAQLLPGSTQETSREPAPAARSASAAYDAGAAQPAIDALNQQLAQLQQQVDQRDKQLDAVRADEDVEQQKLTALKQQRQSEEAAVVQLQAQHQDLESAQQVAASSANAQASAAAAQRQAANAVLQKQSADLQAQVKAQFEELVALRTNQDQERHALDTLHQQRRTEEDAVAHLQSQREQLAAAGPPATMSPPQAARPAPVSHVTPANDTMQTAVAQLRARQREVPPPPPPPGPTAAPAPGSITAVPLPPIAAASRPVYAQDQPKLIVSTKGVLITARELVASGRLTEARDLLMKARAESALRLVTPDQPYATGATAVSNQIGAAINFLDVGNSGKALDSINLAMDNVGTGSNNASTYSATATTSHYPYSSYYDGQARR
jgi:hypothetical protein